MRSFDFANAEFLGQAVFPAIFLLPDFVKINMLKELDKIGISNPVNDQWYKVDLLIAFYEKMLENYGPSTLFELGKAIPNTAKLPSGIDSIEMAFKAMPMIYDMNHRNGYIGFFNYVSHEEDSRKIIIHSYTPYPNDIDRGLLTTLARNFKTGVRVEVEKKDSFLEKEVHYIVTYR